MKSYEIVGYTTNDGDTYCADCGEEDSMHPIFASDEWDYWPTCDECGEEIRDVSLTSLGVLEVASDQGFEVFQIPDDYNPEPEEGEDPYTEGWYWWACQPGCLPDGDPTGPFETAAEAAWDAVEPLTH